MTDVPWSPGSATGVGSLPGDDIREAVRTVLGELPDLPYLPELPARGPGADMIGRAAAMLVELHADLQPSGWRLIARPGRDERRARSQLQEDLDALEELAGEYAGPVKVQVAGPWTLAASLELERGGRVLSDSGAVRDLVASLAEGVAGHVADLRRRLPRAVVLLQLDEPSLPAVFAGRVPTASGYGTLRAIEPPTVEAGLREVLGAAHASGQAYGVVHCCAAGVPLELLRAGGARAVSLDASLVTEAWDDALGEVIEAGMGLFLGVVPATDPAGAEGDTGVHAWLEAVTALPDPAASVGGVRALWRRLGFPPERLSTVVVLTPACGLAGASPPYARAVMAHCRAAAKVLRDDPEG